MAGKYRRLYRHRKRGKPFPPSPYNPEPYREALKFMMPSPYVSPDGRRCSFEDWLQFRFLNPPIGEIRYDGLWWEIKGQTPKPWRIGDEFFETYEAAAISLQQPAP